MNMANDFTGWHYQDYPAVQKFSPVSSWTATHYIKLTEKVATTQVFVHTVGPFNNYRADLSR